MTTVRVYTPAEHLKGYITFYYIAEASAPLTDFLYPEWGNVRFAVSGEWHIELAGCYPPGAQTEIVCGPTDRCGIITADGGKGVGFGLTPLGWHLLIGGDASAMANRMRPYGGELGFTGTELRTAFAPGTADEAGVARLESLLTELIGRRPPVHAQVMAADRILRARPANVVAFAATLGVPMRTLHRLCLRAFGFPPKRLLRRQRFLDTLGHVRSAVGHSLETWLDAGYTDQPHFYRDFRDFMGMSPRRYFSASRELMAHAATAQIKAGVPLSFELPPQPAGHRETDAKVFV